MVFQEPKITKDTPVKYVTRPTGMKKPVRRYKKEKGNSTVTEYDQNFEVVLFHIVRFRD